jgi:membrane protease YdiL (CAAX protease family)
MPGHTEKDTQLSSNVMQEEARAFSVTAIIGAGLIPLSLVIAAALSVDIYAQFTGGFGAIFWGVIACAPLLALLRGFLVTQWSPLADFRRSQLEFFSSIGFRITTRRALILAIIAGVSEEMLFRGALQTYVERDHPVIYALIFPNILFGALHARTPLYALIAGFVGLYLGVCFAAAGSLITPMITHALYDFVALEWTRKAIDAAGRQPRSGRADANDSSVTG